LKPSSERTEFINRLKLIDSKVDKAPFAAILVDKAFSAHIISGKSAKYILAVQSLRDTLSEITHRHGFLPENHPLFVSMDKLLSKAELQMDQYVDKVTANVKTLALDISMDLPSNASPGADLLSSIFALFAQGTAKIKSIRIC